MMEFLENINKVIMNRFKIIYKICRCVEYWSIVPRIDTTYNGYFLSVVDIIPKYYKNYCNVESIQYYTLMYKNRINSINILNKIDLIYQEIKNYVHLNNIDIPDRLKIDLIEFNNTAYSAFVEYSLDLNNENYSSSNCMCSNFVSIGYTELACVVCGKVYFINATAPNNAVDDKQSIKYDFLRHYRLWLDKILAINDKYLNKYEKDIELLEKKIYSDYPIEQQRNRLNIDTIRAYLKNTNLTKLNDIVPILLKKITKNEPPKLTSYEYFDLENIFVQVMKVYDTIKTPNEINRKYYPYFIYKIIEHYFENNNEKKALLKNIHLQKRKTLVTNDLKWKMICDKLPHLLKYKETINRAY